MKSGLKRLVESLFIGKYVLDLLRCVLGKASIVKFAPVNFDGWKMATGTRVPWLNGGSNELSKKFVFVDVQLKKLVSEKKIVLTQFNLENVFAELDGLTWRHYLVYWSVEYAIENTRSNRKNIAEFGVCDGLTAFYATSCLMNSSNTFDVYLYDAWDGMKAGDLLESEKLSEGSYSYLDLDNTKQNLNNLGVESLVYNKGYIPDVFESCENPKTLVWFHIDLNSAIPTIHVLERFWDILEVGGVVLLDDFAWPGYEDTQFAVEKWAFDIQCNILHLPTGQAIIFKLE